MSKIKKSISPHRKGIDKVLYLKVTLINFSQKFTYLRLFIDMSSGTQPLQQGPHVLLSIYQALPKTLKSKYRKDTEPLDHSFMYSLESPFLPVSIHYLQCIHCL